MPASAIPSPKGCFLPVLYEDDEILALHKASGVHSVAQSANDTECAVNAALAHFPKLAGIGKSALEPGLVHRLDQGTSGVLLFAKTQKEYERIREIWKSPLVQKSYLARISSSELKHHAQSLELPLEICIPLGHSAKSSKKMIAISSKKMERQIRGKPLRALTRIHRIDFLSNNQADLEIQIETGLMHQIRVHLAYLGYPIVGDSVYGGEKATRLMLHAWRLRLPLACQAHLTIEAALDPIFKV